MEIALGLMAVRSASGTPVFADLNRYDVTPHFNGQSTIDLDGGRATGESYTIAHTSSELTGSARS